MRLQLVDGSVASCEWARWLRQRQRHSVAAASERRRAGNLILDTAGTYTFGVSDGSLSGATSGSLSVSPTPPARFRSYKHRPAGPPAQALSPAREVVGQGSIRQRRRGATPTVTVAIASGPSGFASGSTTSVAAVNGNATFSNLVLSSTGTYALKFSDGSLTTATGTIR